MHAELTIGDILHPTILACSPDTPLVEAARRMTEAKCSSIVVMVDDLATGIWTEYDALKLDWSNPGQLVSPIERFMSAPVLTIDVATTIGEAALRFLDANVRHFLVTDGGAGYRGILSQSDVVLNQGIEYFVSMRELGTVFTRQSDPIAGTMPLADAISDMYRRHFDAVIVRRTLGDSGILTERDVVRLIGRDCDGLLAQDVASFPIVTLSLNATLFQARKLFLRHRVRHLGVTDSDGQLMGLVSFSDILSNIEHEYVHHLRDALRESEANLARSARRLRSATKAFEAALEGIMVTNAERVIESVNPAFSAITGYAADDVIGRTPSILASGRHDQDFYRALNEALASSGHWQGEICNRRKNGQVYFEWLTINAVRDEDGTMTGYVAVFSDFTARKEIEDQIRHQSLHDPLTGVANRSLLMQQFGRAIAHAKRNGNMFAVVFVDLDHFKQINDQRGHAVGDMVLKTTAARLTEVARGEDTVARIGGDEFVLLIEHLASKAHIPIVVAKLAAAISAPIVDEAEEVRPGVSIGVSVYPDDGSSADALLASADSAMYAAKRAGRGTYRLFGDAGR